MSPRLHVDFVKRLGHMTLQMRFAIDTEILVLFGPSGAGKTQTLQAIAGLSAPDSGSIVLDDTTFFQRVSGKPFVNLPARRRRIGYVFQQYALFPHMSALENVAFPLAGRRDARDRAMQLLERMHLAHLAHRMPHELSGGQQQRVAIARALATEPRVLLFDESFSALDRSIRERLHEEIRTLQAEHHLIVIYVTHNLDDAFAVGHRLAVVRDGRIEQIGRIDDVFTRPASQQVLDILGIPNAICASVVETGPSGAVLDWDGIALEAPPLGAPPGAQVMAYLRPEDIRLIYPDRPLSRMVGNNRLDGVVVERRLGRHVHRLRVALSDGRQIEVVYPASSYATMNLASGERVRLALRKESIVVIAVHPNPPPIEEEPCLDGANRADGCAKSDPALVSPSPS
ncbi:MAG: ABC transporter ATP-binding protein [Roseiflexus sp.]|nr:ABC transporter ATP-binding protein [Roseiflexus sp.]MCS7287550.1 ABC transporter ATP-binding protein [Roseiflexus sp.]MDW8148579.1 ABC transporter ATP-binding protein [Roseiflexaceae bacterium]MDW8231771.1 ABC transporter ATP-binding protein [Roseiflexaceae bacterium]